MSDDLIRETAEHICMALRDPSFDPTGLRRLLTGIATNRPEQAADLLLLLAQWAPASDEARTSNAEMARWEREHERPSEWCELCGNEIATSSRYKALGVRRKHAAGICHACYQAEARAAAGAVGAA